MTSHSKVVENGHSRVEKHSSRIHSPQLIRRRRPTVVAIAAQPIVSGQRSTVQTNAYGQQQLFQTQDGRFFVISTRNNQIQAGQIFQTSDGRIFSVGVGNAQVINEPSSVPALPTVELENDDEEDAEVIVADTFDVADVARRRQQARNSAKEAEKRRQAAKEAAKKIREREEARKRMLEEEERQRKAKEEEEKQRKIKEEEERQRKLKEEEEEARRLEQEQNEANYQTAVQQGPLLLRAPLTPNTARFISHAPVTRFVTIPQTGVTQTAPVFTQVRAAQSTPALTQVQSAQSAPVFTQVRTAQATPALTQVRSAQTVPVGFSLADSVSNGFFVFDNAGVRFDY